MPIQSLVYSSSFILHKKLQHTVQIFLHQAFKFLVSFSISVNIGLTHSFQQQIRTLLYVFIIMYLTSPIPPFANG